MLFNVGFGPIRGASGLLKELNRVIRAVFYHACASTAVESAKVHSHPRDTRGKREGHMRDTSEGGDTNFYGMPTPVFGTVPENHTFFGSFCVFRRSLRAATPPLWCAFWCHFPRTFRASSRLPPRLLSCVFSSRSTGKRSANAPTPLLGRGFNVDLGSIRVQLR